MAEKKNVPEIRFKGFSEEWKEKPFKDTFTSISNNTLSRAELNYDSGLGKNVHYGDILIKFGELLNVEQYEIPFVSNDGLVNKFKSSRLQNGDIILADAAEDETVGKCTEIRNVGDEIIISGLHTIPCRPTEPFAFGFLGYYMNSIAYHNQLIKLMQGTKVLSISKTAIRDTAINYPTESKEQSQIGTYFQNLDKLITLHQQKYDKLVILKKAMLEKMFPKNGADVPEIRFEGFEGKWEERKVLDIFKTVTDKGYPKLPILSASQEFGMIKREETGINIYHNTRNEIGYKRVLPGQFVIHLRSFQGGFAHSVVEGITSPAYTVFDFQSKAVHYDYFWKYIFNSETFIKRLELITYGIRDGRSINYDDFSTLHFLFPSYREQQKIGTYFQNLDKLISLHQKELEKLKNIKKACLEKMFV